MWREASDYEDILAEEELVASAQAMIEAAMARQGVSQRELARRLGVSEPAISKMLGLSPSNLTLRRLARVLRALGDEAILSTRLREDERAHRLAARLLCGPHTAWTTLISADWLAHANENSVDRTTFGEVRIPYRFEGGRRQRRVAA